MNKIASAARLAYLAHRDQRRKWGVESKYALHVASVAGRVMMLRHFTEDMVCAAYLHDIVEDTEITLNEVKCNFGEDVAVLVSWLTNTSKLTQPTASRAVRKNMDRTRLSAAPWEAKIIKLIDRIDNLREAVNAPADFRRLYAEESLLLGEAIGDADYDLHEELKDLANRLLELGGRTNVAQPDCDRESVSG